jgi:peptidoglycan/LPS O-acetylase OafA/YrhL
MAELKKVYFPGMNGIRFIAAFSVIFHHIEQSKFWISMPSLWNTVIVDNIGHKGRIIFFVLSGFLITYLFLAEVKKTGSINVKKFHIRRNLRVWPLYIVIILMSFFILPLINHLTCTNCGFGFGEITFNEMLSISFWKKFAVYLFMFANFGRFLWPPVGGLSQLWSIGVQEQFYLIWPTITRIFKNRFLPMVVIFILGKVLVEAVFRFYNLNWDSYQLPFVNFLQLGTLIKFWEIFAVEQLALGGLAAYIFIEDKQKILQFVYNKYFTILIVGIYIFLFFVHVDFYFHGLVEGLIATFLLLNISTNPKFPVKLEHPILNYLGNISYGIYLFHNFIIIATMNLLIAFGFQSNLLLFNIFLYSITISLTLFLSGLSFKYFEMHFLKLKGKFEVVKSSRKINWDKEKK